MTSPATPAPLYSSAQFLLELAGYKTSTVRSIEGGKISTEILTYQSNLSPAKGGYLRQNGKLKYEPIKVTSSLAASTGLWTWMQSFVNGEGVRHNGAMVAACFDYKERARRTFKEALIEEVAITAFDGNSKNPANVTITIQAETLVYEQPSGNAVIKADEDPAVLEQHVSSHNFLFTYMPVSTNPLPRVTKVDGFSVKCKTIDYHHAGRLDPIKLAGKIEMPNIAFYLPEPDAEPFYKMMRDAAGGNRPDPAEASLEFFNSAKESKGTFKFHGCRVFSAAPDKLDASNEDVRQVKVEMAIEGLSMSR